MYGNVLKLLIRLSKTIRDLDNSLSVNLKYEFAVEDQNRTHKGISAEPHFFQGNFYNFAWQKYCQLNHQVYVVHQSKLKFHSIS